MAALGFRDGIAGKESACNAGDAGSIPGSGRQEEMATHSSILAGEIPWSEKPKGFLWTLQSKGSQRAGHD